jgi:hypothetical protein
MALLNGSGVPVHVRASIEESNSGASFRRKVKDPPRRSRSGEMTFLRPPLWRLSGSLFHRSSMEQAAAGHSRHVPRSMNEYSSRRFRFGGLAEERRLLHSRQKKRVLTDSFFPDDNVQLSVMI